MKLIRPMRLMKGEHVVALRHVSTEQHKALYNASEQQHFACVSHEQEPEVLYIAGIQRFCKSSCMQLNYVLRQLSRKLHKQTSCLCSSLSCSPTVKCGTKFCRYVKFSQTDLATTDNVLRACLEELMVTTAFAGSLRRRNP